MGEKLQQRSDIKEKEKKKDYFVSKLKYDLCCLFDYFNHKNVLGYYE